jgi:prophage regulatory protein
MENNERLIRLPEVIAKTGLSKTTIWRYEKSGLFPKRHKITSRTMAWKLSDIDAYITKLTAVNA